ncbi:NAC domain-containing protein 35-like [Cornus florida]|uniref:NAC domain-containing protein 35-like n=1 Tax=Cornus florida TaxID=4283 RepID=UPI0028A143F8|nr:NAC domain-containing protein 35-like [Cornus florida]
MAIAATMSQDDHGSMDDDQHGHQAVMPGFRFYPTEEELIEFYLRRRVEGKRFNVELITYLDLYRYDPWELPALATIGEKEWFFYVPRDRKYRNGDRPNRVTTSGYWKATGADRMIRAENLKSIGLKKTLVFYFGKAPKGIRTSWIMNEYRLPHHEFERLQKPEISLCRVYKRPGVKDHPSIPPSLPSRASSSSGIHSDKKLSTEGFQAFGEQSEQVETEKTSETSGSSSTEVGTALGLSKHNSCITLDPTTATVLAPALATEEDRLLLHQSRIQTCSLSRDCTTIVTGSSLVSPNANDHHHGLHGLVNYQQASMLNHQQQYHNHHNHLFQFSTLQPLPGSLQAVFADRMWGWNSISEENKEYTSPFK